MHGTPAFLAFVIVFSASTGAHAAPNPTGNAVPLAGEAGTPATEAPAESPAYLSVPEPLIPEDMTEPDFWDALSGGEAYLDFRYRFEHVDEATFTKDANASTLRTVLGYKTLPFHGFTGLMEVENVSTIADGDYNSTINGKTQYPVVADPRGTEINQVYLDYDGWEGLKLRGGRQEVILDNARFVGNVVWRQNHQSFDAATVDYKGIEDLRLYYGSFFNVNRIFGDNSPVGDASLTSHIVNANYAYADNQKVAAYLYYLDFEDLVALSSNTVGARALNRFPLGEEARIDTLVEAAWQQDTGDNPNNVDATYTHLKLDATVSGVTFGGAWEVLGGSGATGDSFQTPLATLFKFNGWADRFLATPDRGLDDKILGVKGKLAGIVLEGYYHFFSADSNGDDYGNEIDLRATYRISEELALALQYADFDSDDPQFLDVRKAWISLMITP